MGRNNAGTITYSGIGYLKFHVSGSRGDTYNIDSTASGTPVLIKAGDGRNAFNLGSEDHLLVDIQGALTVSGGEGDSLNVDDSADTTAMTETLGIFAGSDGTSWGSIIGLTHAAIDYKCSDISGVYVMTGAAADTIKVLATVTPVNLNSRGGGDTVSLGNGGSLQDIRGKLVIDSQRPTTTLKLDDSSDSVGRKASLTNSGGGHQPWNTISGLAPADIVYKAPPFSAINGPVTVVLRAGLGDDTFALGKNAYFPGLIDGGGGTMNVLDYSAYGRPFVVDLPVGDGLGTATGIRDGIYHIEGYVPDSSPAGWRVGYGLAALTPSLRSDIRAAAVEALVFDQIEPIPMMPTDPTLLGDLASGMLAGSGHSGSGFLLVGGKRGKK